MKSNSYKWKEAVESGFTKELKEHRIVTDIPRKRKGKLPTKEFEVMKHLKSCPKQETIMGKGIKYNSP